MAKRLYNSAWKNNPETNRKHAARIQRAQERGQYTPPGTPSSGPKGKVVEVLAWPDDAE